MSNSIFGKQCESMRKRSRVKFVRNETEVLRAIQKTSTVSFKIIDENLATVSSKPSRILWRTPTLVGASILELAKLEMYQFHYQVMKKFCDCELLYSDTDSLLYKVNTNDLYADLLTIQESEK